MSRTAAPARRLAVPGVVACAVISLAGACSAAQERPDRSSGPASDTASEAPSDTPTATTAPVTDLPPGILGRRAAWVLEQVGPDGDPDEQAVRRRFTPDFLEQVTPAQVLEVFDQVRALAPLTIVDVAPEVEQVGQRALAVRLNGSEPVRMELAVDGDGLISGLRFGPDPEATPPAAYESPEELSADLSRLGTAQVYVGSLDGSGCTTTYEDPARAEPAPSGSVFKLVVLTAVVSAVEDGDLGWEEDLTVSRALKSLPSGELQDRPDGSVVSVREAARLMISVSDNTAADVLMRAVGPDRLAEVVDDLGLSHSSMQPMPTTRQFFQLGWGARVEGWAEADAERRAEVLRGLPRDLSDVDAGAVDTPVWREGIDWFLSGEEICRVWARLHRQASTDAGDALSQILRPPREVAGAEGARVSFKGGSAPGVLALSYLVQRPGEDPEVLVLQVRSDTAVDEVAAFAAAKGGVALLAGDEG